MSSSYLDDDLKFPVQADKVGRAKREYVEKGGKDLVGLAMMLGLDPEYLKKRAKDENWSEVRFRDLVSKPADRVAAFEARLDAEPDAMAKHAMVADFLVALSFELAKALSSSSLKHEDMAFLRSRIEAAKSLSEAAVDAVDMARKVRGVEEGTPSVGRVEEGTEVIYKVAVEREVA